MDKNTFLQQLKPLVNVDCGTHLTAGVSVIADLLSEKYKNIGWYVSRENLGNKVGPGLLITNKKNPEYYDVMLIGHMDTVFPEGTVAKRPFTIKGNRAYGPGVADMKSGVLLIYAAVSELTPKQLDKLSIAILHNPDEETGSTESEDWIIKEAAKSKQVLVCESARADGSLVSRRKGYGRFLLEFKGVAAHAGNNPEKGRSAILEMSHWIIELQKLNDKDKGTTVTVGVVSGGDSTNTVPEHAKAYVDLRYWDNKEFSRIYDSLKNLARNTFTPDIEVTVTNAAKKLAMVMNDGTKDLMALIESAGKEANIEIKWQSVGGGSDANITSAHGIPSVDGLGPIGAEFHCDKEYLDIDSIEPRLALLKAILAKIA